MSDTTTAPAFGVHSEVGTLRKVMVCAPGLAHTRLTPSNCDELLFDDVLWVENAKRDHFDFMTKMRDRGIEVVELHNLLAETLAIPEAKAWLLDRKIVATFEGCGFTEANLRETIVCSGQLLKRHRNGGGWVPADQDESDTSKPFVAETAYVGPNARVSGNARVYDNAWVFGSAWVYDNARVSGNAWVGGDARVSGDANVSGTELLS